LSQKELFELEEKYKKAMMHNAQLDNEKLTLRYQVDLLRDDYEDVNEKTVEIQRELKEKTRASSCSLVDKLLIDFVDFHLNFFVRQNFHESITLEVKHSSIECILLNISVKRFCHSNYLLSLHLNRGYEFS
jgi:LRRFIP family